ncbi:MAG: transporter substrate-binding domain-containing protein [Bacteroidaceae bacterium]|nr:transporter substrate-binding domain-containing protein [Bacteroidaceae bacterium]
MNKIRNISGAITCWLLLLFPMALHAQQNYTTQHPIIITGDWDKPPYEFYNDQGVPAGFYIDVLTTILDEMKIPYKFQMMEASKAMELFEARKADLIFDNVRKYKSAEYVHTSNIVSYYRVSVATRNDIVGIVPLKALTDPDETVFYHGGYAAEFFKHEFPDHEELNYQAPKEALTGIVKGKYKYFVWNEAALQWKIKDLNLEDFITLHEVSIPVGDIHIIGRDKALIETIDDHFSRLKQSGKVEQMHDKWFHPENRHDDTSPIAIFITVGILILALIIYLFVRLAKAHVQRIIRNSTDINQMMGKALQMGDFHVMQYDIATNMVTNRYGSILPERGITLEEFAQRIHPDEQEEFHQKMQLLLGGRERRFELEKRWNAGTEQNPKWMRFHGHAIVEVDHEGKPQYVINAIHNITHNVEEEKASNNLQHRFDSLFNMSGTAISFYNRDGWLIMLNERMKALCGFENPDNERFWKTMNMYDIPLFRDAYPPNSQHDLQVCQVMDYPEMGIKNYIEFHVSPIRNEKGEITQYIDTAQDLNKEHSIYADMATLTHRLKETEQNIAWHEQRLHHLLKDSHIYIYDIDFATKTMTFSYSLSHVDYSISIDEYLAMVDDEEREDAVQQLKNYDNLVTFVRHFKYTFASPDPQWICYVGRKKYNEQGNHTGFTGIAIEITNLITTQQQLRETTEIANDSIRLKSVFLASMTHELRTPLNAIVGFATVLKATDDPKDRQELIDIINNSCDMLQRLINDILEASAITSDSALNIKPEEVDFVRAFDNICFTLQQRITQAGLELKKENPYEHFFTTLDIGRVQQIITNFVTNAVKFTQQGHVKLGYRYERHGLYVYCEDTGAGIPKDKQEVIFERFIKLDEFIQGTGMGLNICKGLAERMGGKIGVESEGLGKGSTFWLWLPCERRLTQNVPIKEAAIVTE